MNFQRPFLPLIGLSCVFMAACDKSVEVLPSPAPSDSLETFSKRDTIRGAGTRALTLGKGGVSGFVILPDSGVDYWVVLEDTKGARYALTDSYGNARFVAMDSAGSSMNFLTSPDKDSLFIQAKSSAPINLDLRGGASDSSWAIHVTVGIDSGTSDSFESDDRIQDAKILLPDGTKQHRMLGGWDVDWVKIPVAKGRSYSIWTDAGMPKEVSINVYDESLAVLDTGRGSSAFLEPVRKDGYVLAKVAYTGGDHRVAYTIEATCDSAQIDFFEPESTFDEAIWIPADGKEMRRYIGPGDRDWLRFRTKKGKHYTIRQGEGDGRFKMFLDSTLSDSSVGFEEFPVDFVSATDGVAYIKIENEDDWRDLGSYSISVMEDANVGDSFEPDNRPAQATRLEIGAAPQTHQLETHGRDDFRFAVSKGELYKICIVRANQGGEARFQFVEGFDSLPNYDDTSEIIQKTNAVVYRATGTGTVFLHIVTMDAADTGLYSIQILKDSIRRDEFEPDDHPDSATTIEVNGGPQSHILSAGGDVDWIRFQADSGMSYRVIVEIAGQTSSPNIRQGNPLSEIDAMWVFTARKTGVIRFQVGYEHSRDTTILYNVSVEVDTANIDSYEPDDSDNDSAATIPVDGTPQIHLFRLGDRDRVKFLADSGAVYTVEVKILGEKTKPIAGYIPATSSWFVPDWSEGSYVQGHWESSNTNLVCNSGVCSASFTAEKSQTFFVIVGREMSAISPFYHYEGPYSISVKKQ